MTLSPGTRGVLAYQTGFSVVRSQLVWFDRSGKQIGTLGDQADYGEVALSPDGTRAAVSIVDPGRGTRDVWVLDVARGLRERFTFDAGDEFAPLWSPDGSRIVYSARRKASIDLSETHARRRRRGAVARRWTRQIRVALVP